MLVINLSSVNVLGAELPAPAPTVFGNLTVTVNFSTPEATSTFSSKNFKMRINGAGTSLDWIEMKNTDATLTINGASVNAAITKQNEHGVAITTENYIHYVTVELYNVPQGKYSVTLSGNGYAEYTTAQADINTYSQKITLNTHNGKFAIGDVNGDKTVNAADIGLISAVLASNNAAYDLNLDGIVDITDIALANHNRVTTGAEEIISTTAIVAALTDFSQVEENIIGNVSGNIPDLFMKTPTSTNVKIERVGTNDIQIPITFNEPVPMREISIKSPDEVGAVLGGTAEVLYTENGADKIKTVTFGTESTQLPNPDVQYIFAEEGVKEVIIDLGARVAVKKVTITVTRVDGLNEPKFAVMNEIQFLQNIVPDVPVLYPSIPQNLTAMVASEQVTLTWDSVPNVLGYTVSYGTTSGIYSNTMSTEQTTVTVTGLKNLTTYYFVVRATSTGWEGKNSTEVTAMPISGNKPNPPDMVKLTPDVTTITATWAATKDATAYNVYLKRSFDDNGTEKKIASDITTTSYTLTGLVPDTSYTVFITAKNAVGESGKSLAATTLTNKGVIVPPSIPSYQQIDNSEIENITMTNPNNVLLVQYPDGFNIRNVCDGDFTTHWMARIWWESSEFNFTFKTPKDMDYMVYVPRLDGDYRKSLYLYYISVTDSKGVKTQIVDGAVVQNNPATTGFAILSFPHTTDIKTISVRVRQWDGSPTNITISEVAFYNYYSLNDDIKALFSDETFTSLAGGITQTAIDNIRAKVNNTTSYYVNKDIMLDELALAESLLQGNTNKLGLVFNGIDSRNGSKDIKSINNFQPLGVAATAGTQVVVYAKIPAGEIVNIVPTQYFSEAASWAGKEIQLQNGRNIITIPKIGNLSIEAGGSLYLTYTGSRQNEIALQVRGGTFIPVLELKDWANLTEAQKTTRITDYITKLKAYVPTVTGNKMTAIKNSTEISLPNVLLSLPADQVLAGITSAGSTTDSQIAGVINNTLAWQEFVGVTYRTHGIDDPSQNANTRINIRYMRMFANAFMYASGAHIGIGYGSCAALIQGEPTSVTGESTPNKLFGWGIAHEVGHQLDTLGRAEVSNNIYSLYVQTRGGANNTLTSRVETNNMYGNAFTRTATSSKGGTNDVSMLLAMYWQLHLAYDGASDNFYNLVNKSLRAGTAAQFTNIDDRFAVVASKVSGYNLTDFFTRWGITLSDAAKTEMAKDTATETRNIHYLNDNSLRFRLSRATINEAISFTTAITTDRNTITLNMTPTSGGQFIQGYEILRNGITVGFTTTNTYTDVIGSANNMAMSYTVNAIDILGNLAATDSKETRVAYDRTIAHDWSSVESDGVITVTFNSLQHIAGIKFTSSKPAGGSATISVSTDGINYTTAKTIDLSAGDNVYYFSKPNTNDTRIWTYDALTVKIEGLGGFNTANIDFVQYPGDSVEITEIGYLSQKLVYGTGTDDFIEAGSLIIVGTYRGDPLYNFVSLKGQYLTVSTETGAASYSERAINGYSLLFAEIPSDGNVFTISDGIWVFVPDIQREANIAAGAEHNCTTSVLPAYIKAEIYITDDPTIATNKRLSSDTMYQIFPDQNNMPTITFTGGK